MGSQVAMRVGGDFYFDPSLSDPSVDLLLVAGGVGINPLYSILLHTTDLLHLNQASGGQNYNISSVHLCYSAKNTQELLFKVCLYHTGIFMWGILFILNVSASSTTVFVWIQYGLKSKQKPYSNLPSVFPELHHWGVSGVPRQVLLWLPRHATKHRCWPVPPSLPQPWVMLLHWHSHTRILLFVEQGWFSDCHI